MVFISSPEPSGSQGELIEYASSGVRYFRYRQQCLNSFSSEIAWPIKAKFYVGPLWESIYKWSRSNDQDGLHAHIW